MYSDRRRPARTLGSIFGHSLFIRSFNQKSEYFPHLIIYFGDSAYRTFSAFGGSVRTCSICSVFFFCLSARIFIIQYAYDRSQYIYTVIVVWTSIGSKLFSEHPAIVRISHSNDDKGTQFCRGEIQRDKKKIHKKNISADMAMNAAKSVRPNNSRNGLNGRSRYPTFYTINSINALKR